MKFLIFKKLEDGSYGEKMGSYESDFKDDTSANRSYLMAEPLASHFELPEGMDEDCVELVLIPEVEYQAEKWVKGEEEVSLDPMDESWTYIPAVSAVSSHYELQISEEKVLAKQEKEQKLAQDKINNEALKFLADTDYMILRHLRNKALNEELKITEEEYLTLEQQRSEAALRVVR